MVKQIKKYKVLQIYYKNLNYSEYTFYKYYKILGLITIRIKEEKLTSLNKNYDNKMSKLYMEGYTIYEQLKNK